MTLFEALRSTAERYPEKIAVDAPDGRLSYARLVACAEAAAGTLAAGHAVGRGDRVAYLGLNSGAQLVLLFAAARLGAMLAPLNWRLAAEELRWIAADAAPRVMVADEHFGEIGRAVASCAVLDAAPFGAPFGVAARGRQDRATGPSGPGDAREPPPRTAPGEGGADDPLLLVYTSGATGRPKGTLLSQAAVLANAALSADMHELTAEDRVLTALPMFHVGGLNIQTVPALLAGASVTLMDRFHSARFLDTLARTRPTLTVLVPATIQALLAERGWRAADLSSLRAIATGSTDVPVPLIDAVHSRGVPVIQIYGATETGPVVVYQKTADAFARIGSIGRAGPGVEARIAGPDGESLPDGQVGEIWIRSPTLASGYWRKPDDPAFAGGWFRSGDMARRDADGFLWFADRLKNVIISGGENIYPAELERVLRDIPGVTEAAVIGHPDARWGAVPVAVVVGSATRDAILAAFRGRLAGFKRPRDVLFVDALPRNAMGKVETARLRGLLGGGSGNR